MFFVFKLFFGKSAALATIALFPAITARRGEVCVARSPLSSGFRSRDNQLRAVFRRNSGHRIELRYLSIIPGPRGFGGNVSDLKRSVTLTEVALSTPGRFPIFLQLLL